ncbi:MAG: hypothetical protein IJ519_00955 [Clostridia bacterium]|nr:hypothetical protein [Clostridia bacterium]
MENIYTYESVVDTHDTDAAGYVRPSALLRLIQEAANIQTSLSTPSAQALRDEGKYFVVTKLNLSVKEPLFARDGISVSTWACPSRGVTFNRSGKIEREGEVCATLTSAWALIDSVNGGFARVSDVPFDFGERDALTPSIPLKIRIPDEAPLRLFGEYTVSYRDTDVNGHMNNTVYADMLYGYLPECMQRRVTDLTVNYNREAPYGTHFKIYGCDLSDCCYFRTVLPSGEVGVEAIIRFTEE